MSSIKRAADLEEFSAFIAERTGLYFPREKFRDLELAVSRAAPELGFTGAADCINRLLTSPPDKELLETLAAYLTIGETYFFRNQADFDAIRNIVLPSLTGDGNREESLRIWSAGCATGEEPYSLAMLLDNCSPALKSRAVSILGTDINSKALREAGHGVYGDWSFREVPEHIKATYFTKTRDKKLHLLPRIREMVDFSYLNLAEDSYPSLLTATNAMDLILCRNVLMYFRQDLAEGVLRKFQAALKDGGWLILGPAEGPLTFLDKIPGLEPARLPGLTIYRKAAQPRPHRPSLYAAAATPAAPSRTAAARARPPAPPAPKKRPLDEAGILYRTGRYTEAGKELEALLAAEPQNAAGLVLLARVRANLGRLAEAGKLCAEAIEADKLDPLAHYLLGTIFLEEGRESEAGMSLRKALYLAPDHILAHLALGNLFLRGGKAAWARRHFKNAAALLKRHGQQDVLPDSEGMTAGRLGEIARSALTRCDDD